MLRTAYGTRGYLTADLETMAPHLRDALAKADAGTPHLLSFDGMDAIAATMGAGDDVSARPTMRGGTRASAPAMPGRVTSTLPERTTSISLERSPGKS